MFLVIANLMYMYYSTSFPYAVRAFVPIIFVKVPGVDKEDLKQLLDFIHKLRMSSDFTVSCVMWRQHFLV